MEIKKVALTLGIAILFALFIVFLVDAIYEQPKYEDFCSYQYSPHIEQCSSANCTTVYDETSANSCIKEKGEVRYRIDEGGCQVDQYCDYCSRDFNSVNSKYNKNIFYISAIVGVLAILAGLFLPKTIDAIASGLMFGGIIVLLQGTVRVFGDLGKWMRVLVLGIELILLIWIGYKKASDRKEVKKIKSKK